MERHVRSSTQQKLGYERNGSLAALENCAVFTSLETRGRNRKFRSQQQCLARQGKTYKELVANLDAPKTKYACIVEVDESTRKRLEGTLHKNHEDGIEKKRIISENHFNLDA